MRSIRQILMALCLFFCLVSCSSKNTNNNTEPPATQATAARDTILKLSEQASLLFLRYDPQTQLWYEPRIVFPENGDTVKIEGYSYENGSTPDVFVSPDKRFVVLDNIIKGYVSTENGEELHENYTCAIIDIGKRTVVTSLQEGCGGEWDSENNWKLGESTFFSGGKLISETVSGDVTCKEYSIEMGSMTECAYQGKNLQQVYSILIKNEANFNYHLKKDLPAKDISYESNEKEEDVTVTYQYKTKKHLNIELAYPGGVTSVEIIENAGGTASIITYSAD